TRAVRLGEVVDVDPVRRRRPCRGEGAHGREHGALAPGARRTGGVEVEAARADLEGEGQSPRRRAAARSWSRPAPPRPWSGTAASPDRAAGADPPASPPTARAMPASRCSPAGYRRSLQPPNR